MSRAQSSGEVRVGDETTGARGEMAEVENEGRGASGRAAVAWNPEPGACACEPAPSRTQVIATTTLHRRQGIRLDGTRVLANYLS